MKVEGRNEGQDIWPCDLNECSRLRICTNTIIGLLASYWYYQHQLYPVERGVMNIRKIVRPTCRFHVLLIRHLESGQLNYRCWLCCMKMEGRREEQDLIFLMSVDADHPTDKLLRLSALTENSILSLQYKITTKKRAQKTKKPSKFWVF